VNFSVSSVWVDWSAAAVTLGLLAVYLAAAVAAGRRFGTPGLWAVWFAGIVAGSLFPFLVHGATIAHFDSTTIFFHAAALAVPMGISAWVIHRTLSRPRPVGVAAQLALGALSFILALLVMAVVIFIVIATH
jgi:hypothetical protein